MNDSKPTTLVAKIFAMPVLIGAVGMASLVSGITTGKTIQIFWGVMILAGSTALHFVRKKDWKAHWEEQERYRQAYVEHQARLKEQREKGGDGNN